MIDHKRRSDPVTLVFEQQLARALFRREVIEEAVRVTEHGRTTGHGSARALWIMWMWTKADVRDRCIAEAKEIVDELCNDQWFHYQGEMP